VLVECRSSVGGVQICDLHEPFRQSRKVTRSQNPAAAASHPEGGDDAAAPVRGAPDGDGGARHLPGGPKVAHCSVGGSDPLVRGLTPAAPAMSAAESPATKSARLLRRALRRPRRRVAHCPPASGRSSVGWLRRRFSSLRCSSLRFIRLRFIHLRFIRPLPRRPRALRTRCRPGAARCADLLPLWRAHGGQLDRWRLCEPAGGPCGRASRPAVGSLRAPSPRCRPRLPQKRHWGGRQTTPAARREAARAAEALVGVVAKIPQAKGAAVFPERLPVEASVVRRGAAERPARLQL